MNKLVCNIQNHNDFYIKDGIISEKLDTVNEIIDMQGRSVYPTYTDSHLHIPGAYLFRDYGVLLQGCSNLQEYLNAIDEYKGKSDWIKGFGWSVLVLKDLYDTFYKELNKYKNPIILFSDDYHSCICNEAAINEIKLKNIDVHCNEHGLFKERDIFILTNELSEVCFSDENIAEAILKYQKHLLRYGITSVQSLMMLGGNGSNEFSILKKLDDEGLIVLKINLALTVQHYEDIDGVLDRFEKLRSEMESERIRVNTVKVYLDGVVENGTAYLNSEYTNKSGYCGEPVWNDTDLIKLFTLVDRAGYQIHIHAIGDAAVHQAVGSLTAVMDANNTKNKRRHVIAHMQLADDEDIIKMGEYGIIASMQPYWFPVDADYFGAEISSLGDRYFNQYKVKTLLDSNVLVTFSSDSPVTSEPNPIFGIFAAVNRSNINERINYEEATKAFIENGVYQLYRENEIGKLEVGYHADFIATSKNENNIFIDGELVARVVKHENEYIDNR